MQLFQISSSASVTPNSDTFSVKFSTSQNSLVVGAVTPTSKTNGITTTDGVIDNSANPTIKGLSATFTSPGQYVEYTFYARNEGEYTAYLNNINFLGSKTCIGETGTTESLVQSACESINITATIGKTTYTETTPITGHTLAKNTGEQIKIRLEYASNGVSVDGAFSIKLPDVALVYSTLDDSSIKPAIVKVESGDINTVGSIVSIGAEKFYVIGQEDGNVKLLAMYNLYVGYIVDDSTGNRYPIENPTGLQDSTARGLIDYKSLIIGNPYATWDDFEYEYNGSPVESYVFNYKTKLEEYFGVTVEDARIITEEELIDLGCSFSDRGGICSAAPSWVYTTTYYYYYQPPSELCWVNAYERGFGDNAGRDIYPGVRPVITINKSEF